MSSIYIQEPPTAGKVLLKTSVGDIDIELFSKEAPKACRNFVQLCMEGYYNGTIFHRLVKGFIVQGGDPNGNGTGGESIYGEPFKDEFHSRLRFARRGLLAMANSGPNDNGSQFFFTLGATPELQNKHTIFGKVTGDTIYNMLKLEEGVVDADERPRYPHKINRTEILSNPFDDIEPRVEMKRDKKSEKKSNKREKGVKNFGLLSFGEEAEEDEEMTNEFVKQIGGKSKSTHDVLDDPKLSKESVKSDEKAKKNDSSSDSEEEKEATSSKPDKTEQEIKETTDSIRKKLMAKSKTKPEPKQESSSDSDDDELDLNKEKNKEKKKQAEKIREEINAVKKQHHEDRKRKQELMAKEKAVVEDKKVKTELMQEYLDDKSKYNHLKKDLPKKGASREQFTLDLLKKFRSKLHEAKEKVDEGISTSSAANDEDDDNEDWLGHELHVDDKTPVLAKDAATKQDDWYDVYDPRNPLNKRRRGADDKKDNKHRR